MVKGDTIGECSIDGTKFPVCWDTECTGVILPQGPSQCTICHEEYTRCKACEFGLDLDGNPKGTICIRCEGSLCISCYQDGCMFFPEDFTDAQVETLEDSGKLIDSDGSICKPCQIELGIE